MLALSTESYCGSGMMLAAMCVRKPGDSASSAIAVQSSKSRKHQKPLKALQKSRTEEKKEGVTELTVTVPVKVRDDDDGHLIYKKGDLLDSRCTYTYVP